MGVRENEVTDSVLNALAPLGVKLHRVQTGEWWACSGKNSMLYRMKGAREGVADYCGWRKVRITPEMVGLDIAQFVGVEMKSKTGKAGDAQLKFGEAVRSDGGICGVCKSPEQALQLFEQAQRALGK